MQNLIAQRNEFIFITGKSLPILKVLPCRKKKRGRVPTPYRTTEV